MSHPAISAFVDKNKSPLRWLVLVLGCLMMIGSYYCYDIPAALKTQMDSYMYDPSNYEFLFSCLYSVYSIPNIILPFFGGYFVDTFGVRSCLVIFATLISLGQVIFSIGVETHSWGVMLLGRLVFGLGGESLTVANSALIADWFKGKELAFAMGINLAISRTGSVINNVVSPELTSSEGINFASWFGASLCLASLGCVLITLPIDRSFDLKRKLQSSALLEVHESDTSKNSGFSTNPILESGGRPHQSLKADNPLSFQAASLDDDATGEIVAVKLSDVKTLDRIFWSLVVLSIVVYGCILPFNNIASSLLLERDYFIVPPVGCHLNHTEQCQSTSNAPVSCPSSSWYQPPLPINVTVGGTHYSGQVTQDDVDCSDNVWSSSDSCTYDFCDRLTTAESHAGVIMSIPYIISGVMAPALGLYVDFYGGRAIIATVAPLLLVVVHFSLGYSSVNPIVPLVGQGLAYSGFAAVLWPAIPLVVPERLIGLAYGVTIATLNMGTAALPLVVAAIYKANGDKYIPRVELLFAILGIFGFLIGLYINYDDYTNYASVLNKRFVSDKVSDKMSNDGSGVKERLLTNMEGMPCANGDDFESMGSLTPSRQ